MCYKEIRIKKDNSLKVQINFLELPIFFVIKLSIMLLLTPLLVRLLDKHLHKFHILYINLDLFRIFLLLVKYILLGNLLHMLRKIYIYLLFCKPYIFTTFHIFHFNYSYLLCLILQVFLILLSHFHLYYLLHQFLHL